MCKVAQNRSCRLVMTVVALLWCAAAAAEGGIRQGVNRSVPRGSQLDQVKPVTSNFSIDVENKYRHDLQKMYASQDALMQKALQLLKERKYKAAIDEAEKVLNELKLQSSEVKGEIIASRLAEAEALVEKLRIAWGRERLREAHKAFQDKKLEEAKVLVTEVKLNCPALRDEAERTNQYFINSGKFKKFNAETSLAVANPQLRTLREEASTLLAEAKVFYENKRYDQALSKIEKVYLRDPFNMEAVYLAGQIYREFFTKGYYRHRADFELQAAYTTWQWVEPVFERPEVSQEITVQEKGDSLKAMSDKLNNTLLPEFNYAKGNPQGAVEYLRELVKSRKNPEDRIDIQNITTSDDVAGLGDVTLNLNNVSVGDVIRYICLMSGLKYRIEPNAVIIGTTVENIYPRTYEIQPHVKNMVYANTSADTGSSGGGDLSTNENIFRKRGATERKTNQEKRLSSDQQVEEELKLTEIADINVTSDMFKEYLSKHGIKFGPDSLVDWNDRTNILSVKSTIENLDAISPLIREQNALQAPLILVEVKCIEISDNDMEELGFDWSLGDTNLNKNMNNDGVINDPTKGGWMLGPGSNVHKNSQTGERGSMNPIRTGFMDGSSSVPFINNLNIFPMLFGSKTPFGSEVPLNISLTVNALSQNTRTEVISAPKVVALSGITASAKMTKSYYFPDSWSDLEIDVDTGDNDTTYTIQRPTPEFGDEQEIGIDMKVTPSMTETGAINLKLDFEVTGTNGNDEFTFVLNGNVNGRSVSHSFTIWKPVITERKVLTDIDVYDGQTVVVGGSTDNRTVTRCDKIPFLGELPLIGRLFQAQSEKAERRNMLVFVTARQLGTDGAPVATNNQGAPDFNR